MASLLAFIAAPVCALDAGDIIVTRVDGEVQFMLDGAVKSLKAGAVLKLPAVVRTGKDGAVELKQGATSIRVGPETELNFPATESRGGPIDRVIQSKGNAFYDIGKRGGRKFRVETPVLVGVVKGTQFNVTASEDGATISLFEGRLEIQDMSGGAIDLQAGEIASRKSGDGSTNVWKMSSKAAPTGTPPKTSSAVRAPGGDVIAANARDTSVEPGDNLASGLLASDLAIAGGTAVPSPLIDPVTGAPEAPVVPAQPDVGIDTPAVETPVVDMPVVDTPPPVEAPTPPVDLPPDVAVPPDLGVGGDVTTPPDTGAGGIPHEPVTPPADPIPDLDTTPDPGELPDLDVDDDDGNNGHGNDDDRDDSSNSGHGRSGRR